MRDCLYNDFSFLTPRSHQKLSNSNPQWSCKPQEPDILKGHTPASNPGAEGARSHAEEKRPSWGRPPSQREEGPSETAAPVTLRCEMLHFLELKLRNLYKEDKANAASSKTRKLLTIALQALIVLCR